MLCILCRSWVCKSLQRQTEVQQAGVEWEQHVERYFQNVPGAAGAAVCCCCIYSYSCWSCSSSCCYLGFHVLCSENKSSGSRYSSSSFSCSSSWQLQPRCSSSSKQLQMLQVRFATHFKIFSHSSPIRSDPLLSLIPTKKRSQCYG